MKQDLAEVKNWLKSQKKHYSWLAQQCHVSEGSVKNWFFKGRIPTAKYLLIQRLMNEDGENKFAPGISLNFTDEQWEIISKILASSKQTFIQFINEALENAAQEMLEAHQKAFKKKEADISKQFIPVEPFPAVASLDYTAQVAGNTAAGKPADGGTLPQEIRIYRPLEKGEYILRVSGKSMEPKIPDGSLVVVREYKDYLFPKPGTLVVYNEGNDYTLKKLVKRKNPETGKQEYALKPINPSFKEVEPIAEGKISAVYVETLDRWEKA